MEQNIDLSRLNMEVVSDLADEVRSLRGIVEELVRKSVENETMFQLIAEALTLQREINRYIPVPEEIR